MTGGFRILALLGLCFLPSQPLLVAVPAGVLYVDRSASAGGDGTSWTRAFQHLQDALAAAGAPNSKVTEIRLAGGVYQPDRGAAQTPGDPNATFNVLPYVSLRGGYAGLSGTNPDLRDLGVHETVLSGRIGEHNHSHKSRHVVCVGSQFSRDTVVEGVTITGGYANGSAPLEDVGAGLLVYGEGHFADCRIVGNQSIGNGAGVYLAPYSRLTLTRCVVSENWTASTGGGAFADVDAILLIEGCQFNGNDASEGGAVACMDAPVIATSSIFSGNYAGAGPTFYSDLHADVTIVNCTVAAAWPGEPGTGLTVDGPFPPATYRSGAVRMSNCILWNDGQELAGLTTHSTVEYCHVRSNLGHPGTSISYADPLFVRPPDLDAWPPDCGDLRLQPGSPCVDAGNSLTPPAIMRMDVDGRPRRYDDPTVLNVGTSAWHAPAIDIGAHELHPWSPADFNFDHHVDMLDWGAFAACHSGAVIVQDLPACLPMDLDLDNDVDMVDFGLFQQCLSRALPADPFCLDGRGIRAKTTVEQCETPPWDPEGEYPFCGDSQIDYVVTGPGELTIIRRNAVYNCCPDLIDTVVAQDHGRLRFLEHETALRPCPCLCCYTVQTRVTGLSGTFAIEYCWDRWGKPRTCSTTTVNIP